MSLNFLFVQKYKRKKVDKPNIGIDFSIPAKSGYFLPISANVVRLKVIVQYKKSFQIPNLVTQKISIITGIAKPEIKLITPFNFIEPLLSELIKYKIMRKISGPTTRLKSSPIPKKSPE